MYHLRLAVFLSMLLVLVHCVATAPSHRYFKPSSSSEQEDALSLSENWLTTELLNLMSAQVRSWPKASNSHYRERRGCNTATCMTQRLADVLVRSSNIMGTVYVPTNVGSGTYGRRELPQGFLTL